MSRPTPVVDIARHEAAAKLLPAPRLAIGGDDLLAGIDEFLVVKGVGIGRA